MHLARKSIMMNLTTGQSRTTTTSRVQQADQRCNKSKVTYASIAKKQRTRLGHEWDLSGAHRSNSVSNVSLRTSVTTECTRKSRPTQRLYALRFWCVLVNQKATVGVQIETSSTQDTPKQKTNINDDQQTTRPHDNFSGASDTISESHRRY